MIEHKEFLIDEIFGERLLISIRADQTELDDNIRVARVVLTSFTDMFIIINEHLLTIGHKNPEYTINGKLGDRKGVESENGIKSAFRKAKQQGCKVVVLDFDMHMSESILKTKKIVSGQIKKPNHQYIEISTAYPDPSVPFHDDQKVVQHAMERDFNREADQELGVIWAQDSLDETFKEETWVKSNPLLDLKDQRDVLLNGLRDKRDSDMLAGTVDDFQNKNLNLWLQEATNSYLKLSDIERAIIPSFDIRGRDVYIGFDYSMFSDNTAIAFVYPYQDGDGRQKWHIEQHSFIPWEKAGSIQAKEKQDGIDYRKLAKKGYCTITSHPQGLINDDQVYSWLLNYVEENSLHVIFFGYDAWGATNAIKQMDINTGFPLEAIRQRTSELKDPTKFLQKIFVEGNCSRLDDKIMEKALINAEIYEDKIGIQVDKAKATLKIDVVDAIIDALYQGMYHFEDFGIANDKSKQAELMTAEQVKAWFESEDSGLLDS